MLGSGTGARAPQADVATSADRMYEWRVGTESSREHSTPTVRDRIRWGPVWAGLIIALATYLLLQLALVASGVVDLAEPSTNDAVTSAVAAMVSFLLGGIVAGATAIWRGLADGILHGVVMWALGLVALVLLSAAGSGLALGSIDTTKTFDMLQAENVDRSQASDDAQSAAAKALLGVSAALLAAGAGGAIGVKMWPRRRDDEIDLSGTAQGTTRRRLR